MELDKMETETRNANTMDIDNCSSSEIVEKINREDAKVAEAVGKKKEQIAEIIDKVSERMKKGGRLIYIGAGTSGRLGVLDASECPPTYGVCSDLVVGLIAGGQSAMFKAKEGAEDDYDLGRNDLVDLHLNANDSVIGLAASGRTPYVIGGLDYAKSIGAYTASVSCVSDSEVSLHCETAVEVITGPEVITGSTRMKAGTAEKMICNMISTGCMIHYGKVFENLMVDVQPTNEKLVVRAKSIIAEAVHCDAKEAEKLFEASGKNVKIAILMGKGKCDKNMAEKNLAQCNGNVHHAIVHTMEKAK